MTAHVITLLIELNEDSVNLQGDELELVQNMTQELLYELRHDDTFRHLRFTLFRSGGLRD